MTAAVKDGTAVLPSSFWPKEWGDHPVIDEVRQSRGYLVEDLPRTAVEFLDRLGELGYEIRKHEDLGLQDSDSAVGVIDRLDGRGLESAGVAVSAYGVAGVGDAADVSHGEGSSRWQEGAGTPVDRTVGDDADTVGGAGRDSRPGQPAPPAIAASVDDLRAVRDAARDAYETAVVVRDSSARVVARMAADGSSFDGPGGAAQLDEYRREDAVVAELLAAWSAAAEAVTAVRNEARGAVSSS